MNESTYGKAWKIILSLLVYYFLALLLLWANQLMRKGFHPNFFINLIEGEMSLWIHLYAYVHIIISMAFVYNVSISFNRDRFLMLPTWLKTQFSHFVIIDEWYKFKSLLFEGRGVWSTSSRKSFDTNNIQQVQNFGLINSVPAISVS